MDAVETARLNQPRLLVSVAEIDDRTVGELRAELEGAIDAFRRTIGVRGARHPLVVDLGWVTYLDRSGAIAFADAVAAVAAAGGRMVFTNAAPGVRSVLEAAGLQGAPHPQRI